MRFRDRLSWRRLFVTAVVVVLGAALVMTYASSKSARPEGAVVSVLSSAKYGTVLVVGAGKLAKFPLYEFSGDAPGHLGCGTAIAKGYDFDPDGRVSMSCTGPERDLLDGAVTDDWPAFTTTAKPIAGRGVNPKLLATVFRHGIGEQVTYAGQPLYLYDPSSYPFDPAGEDYGETVAPLGPWHGYWSLVNAQSGAPAPGRATLEVSTLPGGLRVLGVERDQNINPVSVALYTYRAVSSRARTCTGACARVWVPLLTNVPALVSPGIDESAVGVVRLSNGSLQVTYDRQPLYLYSRERFLLKRTPGLYSEGTSGNGNDVTAPAGGTFSLVDLG